MRLSFGQTCENKIFTHCPLRRCAVIRVRDLSTVANLASGVIFDTKATAEDLSLVVQEAIHGPRHIGKATPDNGLVERGISRRTVSPACDVRQSTGGERLHHLSQFFSVVSGLSCEMDEMYGHSFAIHLCKKASFAFR